MSACSKLCTRAVLLQKLTSTPPPPPPPPPLILTAATFQGCYNNSTRPLSTTRQYSSSTQESKQKIVPIIKNGWRFFFYPQYSLPGRENIAAFCVRLLPANEPKRPKPRTSEPKIIEIPFHSTGNSAAMSAFVEVIGTPSADCPASWVSLVFGDGERYVFGHLAEGTQRLAVQRSLRFGNINNLFITGPVDWQSVGGLLGFLLTAGDGRRGAAEAVEAVNVERRQRGLKEIKGAEMAPVNVHGGRNLVHAMACARPFVFRKDIPLRLYEVKAGAEVQVRKGVRPDFEDEHVRVWHVPVSERFVGSLEKGEGEGEKGGEEAKVGGDGEAEAVEEETARSQPAHAPVEGVQVEDASEEKPADEEGQMMLDDAIRAETVRHMFGTNTKSLVETISHHNLSEVPNPKSAHIYVKKKGTFQHYDGPLPEPGKEIKDRKVYSRHQFQPARELPRTTPSDSSMCYIVKNHPRRGKFDPAAARSFGLKPGVQYKLLTDGHSVTSPSGVVIHPHMVLGPTIAAVGFAMIDLRSANLVEAFLKRPEWSDKELMEGVQAMFWTLGEETKGDARIAEFMKERKDVKHVLIGQATSNNLINLESPAEQMVKLHQIDPDRFPLPVYSNEYPELPASLKGVAEIARPGVGLNVALGYFSTKGARPPVDLSKAADSVLKDPELMSLIAAARERVSDPNFVAQVEAAEAPLPTDGVEVVALGTGSAMPSKHRNVSSAMVRVPGWGTYIFDCGENTLGQLRRLYGFDGADRILEDIRCIYISHHHADHHLGTASVLARRHQLYKANPQKVGACTVACSEHFSQWMLNYQMVQDMGCFDSVQIQAVNVTSSRNITKLPELYIYQDASPAAGYIALPLIQIVPVDHCPSASAVVMTWPTGLKIAYSGDCRPSEALAKTALGAHLLIHECTFDSEMQDEAIAKKHSTMAEALEVGRQMRADKILLTHFSQRYPKMPVVEETDQTVLFAFDLMTVKLRDFKYAAEFLPAIRKLLEEAPPEEEEVLVDLEDLEGGEGQGQAEGKEKGKKGKKGNGKEGGDQEGEGGEGKKSKRQKKREAREAKEREEAEKIKQANLSWMSDEARRDWSLSGSLEGDRKRERNQPRTSGAVSLGPWADLDEEPSPRSPRSPLSKRARVK